jgi:hypothetical protein
VPCLAPFIMTNLESGCFSHHPPVLIVVETIKYHAYSRNIRMSKDCKIHIYQKMLILIFP